MADELNDMLDSAVRETETEILTDAFKDEAPVEKTEAEPEKAVEEAKTEAKTDRNEKGQFIAKSEQKSDDKPKGEEKSDDAGQIPSWRLREESEARRAAEQRANAVEARMAQLQARLDALDKPKEQKQEDIDPLLDPQGFSQRLQEGFTAKLREIELNNNLAIAHVRHGDKFEKAYEALLSEGAKGNRQLVNSLVSRPNPGEAIVKWFSDQETLREVGGDPAAYKQKLLEEALSDPEFLAKATEAARQVALGGKSQAKPRVEIPPSLSRATGSSKNSDPIDTDNSEKAVFDYAFSN